MFDTIAPRYDFVNRMLALGNDIGWRKVMVKQVVDHAIALQELENRAVPNDDGGGDGGGGVTSGGIRILDLATGTADVAILLGKELRARGIHVPTNAATESSNSTETIEATEKPGAIEVWSPPPFYVLGVDPSHNMIEIGRQKLVRESVQDVISLHLGDSRNLHREDKETNVETASGTVEPRGSTITVESNAYDAITMSFGIRNVPQTDRSMAFCEMFRVLKKPQTDATDDNDTQTGGRLAILEFSEPGEEAGIMGYFAKLFIRYIVPTLGAVLSGAPSEYLHLQNSIDLFPSPTEFVQALEGVECDYVEPQPEESAVDTPKKKWFQFFRKKHANSGSKTITAPRKGGFRVESVQHMNFGSVQLYIAKPVFLEPILTN